MTAVRAFRLLVGFATGYFLGRGHVFVGLWFASALTFLSLPEVEDE